MKLKIPHRKEYESLYREYWLAQNKQDRLDNPRFNGTKEPNAPAANMFQAHGKMGGRPVEVDQGRGEARQAVVQRYDLEGCYFHYGHDYAGFVPDQIKI